VRASVLDALRHGFETHLIVDATRPVDELEGTVALREMPAGGAVLEPGDRTAGE
jgi:nicotinamidase-related amidase